MREKATAHRRNAHSHSLGPVFLCSLVSLFHFGVGFRMYDDGAVLEFWGPSVPESAETTVESLSKLSTGVLPDGASSGVEDPGTARRTREDPSEWVPYLVVDPEVRRVLRSAVLLKPEQYDDLRSLHEEAMVAELQQRRVVRRGAIAEAGLEPEKGPRELQAYTNLADAIEDANFERRWVLTAFGDTHLWWETVVFQAHLVSLSIFKWCCLCGGCSFPLCVVGNRLIVLIPTLTSFTHLGAALAAQDASYEGCTAAAIADAVVRAVTSCAGEPPPVDVLALEFLRDNIKSYCKQQLEGVEATRVVDAALTVLSAIGLSEQEKPSFLRGCLASFDAEKFKRDAEGRPLDDQNQRITDVPAQRARFLQVIQNSFVPFGKLQFFAENPVRSSGPSEADDLLLRQTYAFCYYLWVDGVYRLRYGKNDSSGGRIGYGTKVSYYVPCENAWAEPGLTIKDCFGREQYDGWGLLQQPDSEVLENAPPKLPKTMVLSETYAEALRGFELLGQLYREDYGSVRYWDGFGVCARFYVDRVRDPVVIKGFGRGVWCCCSCCTCCTCSLNCPCCSDARDCGSSLSCCVEWPELGCVRDGAGFISRGSPRRRCPCCSLPTEKDVLISRQICREAARLRDARKGNSAVSACGRRGQHSDSRIGF